MLTRTPPHAIPRSAKGMRAVAEALHAAESLDLLESGRKRKKGSKVKKEKDPDAPKRPASAYLLFQTEFRKGEEYAAWTGGNTEKMQRIAEVWKNMDEEDKAVRPRCVRGGARGARR